MIEIYEPGSKQVYVIDPSKQVYLMGSDEPNCQVYKNNRIVKRLETIRLINSLTVTVQHLQRVAGELYRPGLRQSDSFKRVSALIHFYTGHGFLGDNN